MEATDQGYPLQNSALSKHDDCEDGNSHARLTSPKETHDPMDLDEILDELGHFGKFQSLNFILISFPIIFAAIFALSYVFTAGDLNYRCLIPECEDKNTSFMPHWLKNAIPFRKGSQFPSKCLRYAYSNNASDFLNDAFDVSSSFTFPPTTTSGLKPPLDIDFHTDFICMRESFNQSQTYHCNEWVYENEGTTILREWNITCEENRWALTIVGTINNIGQFIGMPIAGFVSDRIGRKKTLVLAVLLAGIMGIGRSLSWSYTSFLAFEFLDPLCGSGLYTAGFVLGMELVGPKGRVFAGTIISVFYTIGEVILGSVAMWLQNWRLILRTLYIPALFCVVHYWLTSESVRWLLANGRNKEACNILLKAARTNKVVLPQQLLNKIRHSGANRDKYRKAEIGKRKKGTFLQIFTSKILLKRLINSAFCWFSITFVFFGLSLNSVSVGGNKYSNFILVALIELPAYFVFYICMDRIGRKNTLCASLILSGVSCVAFAFLPPDMDLVQLLLFLMGKFGITISFAVVFVFTAELFPTELRHSMLGTCAMLGRIGSVIAPQTPLLGIYFEALPLLLFGAISVVSGFLSFTFPETLNMKLPDTIEEAENIGKKIQC